jgi:hypothetical protein
MLRWWQFAFPLLITIARMELEFDMCISRWVRLGSRGDGQ